MAASSSAESKMYTASYSRDNAGKPPFGHVRLPRVAVAEGEWPRSGGRRARRAISRQINNLARARARVKEREFVCWRRSRFPPISPLPPALLISTRGLPEPPIAIFLPPQVNSQNARGTLLFVRYRRIEGPGLDEPLGRGRDPRHARRRLLWARPGGRAHLGAGAGSARHLRGRPHDRHGVRRFARARTRGLARARGAVDGAWAP